MTNTALPPILEDYRRQIESLKAEAQRMVDAHTAADLQDRPSSTAWSAIECLDHLRVTAKQYLFTLDAAMAAATKTTQSTEEPKYNFVWRFFIKSMEPPPGRRFTAPKPFEPAVRPDVATTLAAFLAEHDALIERIHTAADYDLKAVKVVSPASSLLKVPLGAVFAILAAHGRRHLWQARQALASPELPG